MMRTSLVAGVLLVALAWAPHVRAQTAEEMKRAEVYFEEGQRLLNAGRFEEACPRLVSAQNLVPGIGVTLYLAECYEQTGRWKAAWDQFKKAEELATQKADKRADVARERAARLWPKLAKLKVVVSPADDVPGFLVTDEGSPVERSTWGTERPVDPKVHKLRASAPQRETWEMTVDASAAGATVAVQVPLLKETGAAGAVPVAPLPTGQPGAEEPPPTGATEPPPGHPHDASGELGPRRVAGIAVFGVGVVALGVGVFTGLYALSKKNTDGCNANDQCTQAGLDDRSSGMTAATVSTIAFPLGAVAVAGGVLLYLTAPKNRSVAITPTMRPGGGSLDLRATW